jgi:N-acetylneuraminic acid mutarotase
MNNNKTLFSLLPPLLPLLLLAIQFALVHPSAAAPFAFDATSSLINGREFHTATLLPNGKVLVVGGIVPFTTTFASAELFDPSSGTWTSAGSLSRARCQHTATLLPNGKVLIAGGLTAFGGTALASCEIYDPSTGSWSATGNMETARDSHTATLLPDGRVLVADGASGGFYNSATVASAEVYDPDSGLWTTTQTPNRPRSNHTATLLPNGKVLVAGGANSDGALESAELFDPGAGTWAFTGNLTGARYTHVGTLLSNGKVLIAGGYAQNPVGAELYDPATGTWTSTGNLVTPRRLFSASLLPNGKVLIVGGVNDNASLPNAELYDPSTGTWQATGSLGTARYGHTATLLATGKVLVAGGFDNSAVASCELFDPSNGGWIATATESFARALHTATILPNGQVLVAGGTNGSTTLGSADLYDSPTSTWLATASLNGARSRHTATLLSDGKVLVAGGANGSALATAELYDRSNGTWANTGTLHTSRYDHTATLLPNGKVLVTGGVRASGVPPTTTYVASAELYDPASGTWAFTGSMAAARHNHTATLLPNGKVLVAGGSNGNNNFLATCELYDPSTGAWSATGSMANPRELHSATLLPRQQVLVAGGTNDATAQGIVLNSVEIYNPSTGAWVIVPSLGTAREGHTATLMPDGRVLVYGGLGNGSTYLTSAELYDPATVKWTATGSSSAQRFRHTATLLPNGTVLAVGGYFGNGTATTNASLYDAGFGFLRPAWQPQISSAFLTSASDGAHLFLAGSRFQGISQASGGTAQDSSTNYPVVQLRSIDNNQEVVLLPDPAFGWSDQLFRSPAITGFPTGPALVTVFSNGIPSDAYYLSIQPPIPTGILANISTRLRVLGGDNVLIAGMIATGNSSKKVIIRALGPSLSDLGVPDALPDPTLELFKGNTSVAINDDWRASSQQAEIQSIGFAPAKEAESVIIASLAPGQNYTAVVRGKNGETGVALVEVYDLDTAAPAKLANISTRGFVGTDDDVMIAGVIISPPNGTTTKIVVRALGPTLTDLGVSGALANPTLQLLTADGTVIRSNDSWKTFQQAEIEAAHLAPAHDEEAALIENLAPGQYTAVVRGSGNATGIGLVEVYNIP